MALTIDPGSLRVDVVDAAGAKVGVLVGLSAFRRTRRLNAAGECEFTFAMTDPKGSAATFGRRYRVYHKTRGLVGEYVHRAMTQRAEQRTTTIKADSTLILLGRKSALFNRRIDNQSADLAAADLVALANGHGLGSWVCNANYPGGTEPPHVSLEIQGQSILQALDALRRKTGANFREQASFVVEFGTFGTGTATRYGVGVYDEDVYLGNFVGVTYYATNVAELVPETENSQTIIVTDCEVEYSGDGFVNRIYPLGAGDGLNQLTLAASYDDLAGSAITKTYNPVINRTANPDGTWAYYIEDTASLADNGLSEAPLVQSDMRPLTNSDVSIRLASDALYDTAAVYLDKHRVPQVVYRVTVASLPAILDVGDNLNFRYIGLAYQTDESGTEALVYLNASTTAVITEIEETFTDAGVEVALTLSTNGEHVPTDADVVLGIQREVNAMRVAVVPSGFRDSVAAREVIAPGYAFEFDVPIEGEVLYVQSAVLQFVTKPFRSLINPDLFNLGTVLVGETSEFVKIKNGSGVWTDILEGQPILSLAANPNDGGLNVGRVRHYHGIPVFGGYNSIGGKLTWNGSDLYSGDEYGNALPGLLVFGDRVGRGYSGDTDHNHYTVFPQHRHTSGGSVDLTSAKIGFGIYDDKNTAAIGATPTNAPGGILVYLNGTLIAGPFDANNGVVRKINISNAILAAGTRRIHKVRFECATGRGIIDANVRLFMTGQSTLATQITA